MHPDIREILLGEDEIDRVVTRLAAEISRDYGGLNGGRRILLVGILKGSAVFLCDLMRRLDLPVEIGFMKVSSYGSGSVSTGSVNISLDLPRGDTEDCDLLIIEDIVDSGNTLSYLTGCLSARGAHSVKTCALLDKPSRRTVAFEPDYRGMVIPDEFVVGYGLDYAEKYRSLPYIGILKPSVYGG